MPKQVAEMEPVIEFLPITEASETFGCWPIIRLTREELLARFPAVSPQEEE
jgi:hypothetical protein